MKINKMSALFEMFGVVMKKKLFGFCSTGSENQIILKNQYKIMRKLGIQPSIEDVGFRTFSQFEEDGILLYIFSLIGEGSKKVVEICCGTGNECMAANLIINHGWDGLLFEGGGTKSQKM